MASYEQVVHNSPGYECPTPAGNLGSLGSLGDLGYLATRVTQAPEIPLAARLPICPRFPLTALMFCSHGQIKWGVLCGGWG